MAESQQRPGVLGIPALVSLAVAAAAFASYAATACRTITWWDGSSYPLAAYTLGVAPPPGSLILTLLGWLATRIPAVHPVAFQLNLLAALIAAALAGLVTWIGIRVSVPEGRQAGAPEGFAGAFAGLMFAFAPTPWNYAVQFTPYVLSACFTGLILLAALGWWRRAEHSDSAGRLFLLFLLLGLDFSVHRTNSLLLPAALVWVALRRGGASLRPPVLGAVGFGLAAGLAFQLLLIPIASRNPAFNQGEPSSLARLWSYVSISDKGGGFLIDLFPRRADFVHVQLGDYAGFLRRNLTVPLPGALAYVPAIVAALGCAVALRSSPRRSLGLIGFFLCASLGSVLYFNLPEHWFRTLDRHYLPSLVLLTPFMATGGAASLRLAIGARGLAGSALAIGLGGLLAIAPIRSWAVNRRACDLARVRYAETFGRNLLEPLERDAILLTNGDNDTFPLWYLQEVEGARRDVTVINLPTANLGWWIAQLRRGDPRYARLLEGERGMDVLEPVRLPDSTVTLPVAPDAPLGIRQPASRPAAVTFSISGRLYGDDRVVLDLLRIERWRRPLYIACTVTRDQVPWLWPYARLDGLAFRVVPSADPTAWDVDHARRQLTEKMTYAGLADSTVAMDQDSQLMSRNYLASFIQVALAQIDRGDAHGCLDTLAFLEAHVPLARLGAPADLVDGLRARAEAELSSTRQP